ncbi:helix-turn-helix domain-containing protein [Actinomycetospora termitidis]|uniref:Helix-turn-helix domain-containing protein n=1 Tax=Actinomycetospora termitidis TaxID=3053470 RepID=A0ABT7M549_9PSEU|nr:helix-turn-helix domain-containing protein [Actinomycetospora sp. Odt1-22]MDL5154558.1 helix-turn-helix domain-containing protein [Actinomycetospora sp. Odt1-22]
MRDEREIGGAWRRHQRHQRREPPADLATWADHLWSATWDYASPYAQKIAPSAVVHLTARDGAPPEWHGPTTRHVVRELTGRGGVVGIALRPGLARDLVGRPVSTLADTAVAADGPAGMHDLDALAAWLRARVPVAPSPDALVAAEAVELARDDPNLRRVEDLAARCGRHPRRLQRLFAEHVGVGPKAVLRWYRLGEVTRRMASGRPIAWAALAHDLGYADQAHLVRDVTALLGESPTAYAARYPRAEIL